MTHHRTTETGDLIMTIHNITLDPRDLSNALKAAAKFTAKPSDNTPALEKVVAGLAPKGLTLTATNRYIVGQFLVECRTESDTSESLDVGLLDPVKLKAMLAHLPTALRGNVELALDADERAMVLTTGHGESRTELDGMDGFPRIDSLRRILTGFFNEPGSEIDSLGYTATHFASVLAAQKLIKCDTMGAKFLRGDRGGATQHILAEAPRIKMLAAIMPPRIDGEVKVGLEDFGL